MSLQALLAILTVLALCCLIFGLERALRPDRRHIEKRLRRYGSKAF
jgi:hypothetical protein